MNDVLVIGAGLSGLFVARELVRAGLKTCVVERGHVGRQSSWAGGGIISPLYPWRYPDAVNELVRWSQAVYPALSQELADTSGIDSQWTDTGMLICDPSEWQAARDWAGRHGTTINRISGPELRNVEPSLNSCISGALWMPALANVRNPRLLKALHKDLLIRGVSVVEHAPVLRIKVQGDRVLAVETTNGTLNAETVVVAGGAWTSALLGTWAPEKPVEPVRGQMVLFRASPGALRRMVLQDGRYLIPRRDGRILAGSTLEHCGFDAATTQEAYASLRQAAQSMVPGLADVPIERHWAGLRPGTGDGVPIIGRHRQLANLYINAGHYRNGVAMGPAAARLAADLILGRPPILDSRPYLP